MPYKKSAHEISIQHAHPTYLLARQKITRWVLIVLPDVNQTSPLELADTNSPTVSALR